MTCQQPISHDLFHSACKIKETTDEQSTSEQVRGKPEDQPTATECVCCPTCPQPIGICRQIDGKPDTKEPTDEQVRGKPEDQLVAAERVHCPICPQHRCICHQECGGPDKGIHCPKITPENSCTPKTRTQNEVGPLELTAKPPDMNRQNYKPTQHR